MAAPRIITLTTDFGHGDTYVGQMKAAALRINPRLQLVDLCHDVPPQDVSAAAYLLETGYATFPRGTIHLAVVDPGVGSSRSAVAVRTNRYDFLAPDNGLLTRVLRLETPRAIHLLREPAYRRTPTSPTFEGRDVFAPAAAWLAGGLDPAALGPSVQGLVELPLPQAAPALGEPLPVPVAHIDHFGNVVLDVNAQALGGVLGHPPWDHECMRLEVAGRRIQRFCTHYAQSETGDPFLLLNSAGYLELACRGDRADRVLGVHRGASAMLTLLGC